MPQTIAVACSERLVVNRSMPACNCARAPVRSSVGVRATSALHHGSVSARALRMDDGTRTNEAGNLAAMTGYRRFEGRLTKLSGTNPKTWLPSASPDVPGTRSPISHMKSTRSATRP